MIPLRGDVYQVKFDPTEGNEIKKSRSAIIISNDAINRAANVVIVCPITASLGKGSPIHIQIPVGEAGLTKESVAHCGQIRAVDKSRLGAKFGALSPATMEQVNEGIRNTLRV